jgi:hypothetical protein
MGHSPVPDSRRLVLSLRSPFSLLMGRHGCPASCPHPQRVPLSLGAAPLALAACATPLRCLRMCQSVLHSYLREFDPSHPAPPAAVVPAASHPARDLPGASAVRWTACGRQGRPPYRAAGAWCRGGGADHGPRTCGARCGVHDESAVGRERALYDRYGNQDAFRRSRGNSLRKRVPTLDAGI